MPRGSPSVVVKTRSPATSSPRVPSSTSSVAGSLGVRRGRSAPALSGTGESGSSVMPRKTRPSLGAWRMNCGVPLPSLAAPLTSTANMTSTWLGSHTMGTSEASTAASRAASYSACDRPARPSASAPAADDVASSAGSSPCGSVTAKSSATTARKAATRSSSPRASASTLASVVGGVDDKLARSRTA